MVRSKIKNLKIINSISIRADWSEKIGYGHFKRSLAIGELFAKKNFEVFLFTKSDFSSKKHLKNMNIIKIKNEYEAVKILKKRKIKLIIMDIEHSYQNTAKLKKIYSNYQKIGISIICWDSVFKTNFPFQAIYRPYPNFNKFPQNIRTKKIIAGLKYLYLNEKKYSKKKNKKIQNILVTFGGTNKIYLIKYIINSILQKNITFKIHIIMNNFKKIKSIKKIFINNKINFHNFFPNINIAINKLKIDFAITSVGMTKYEIASLGVPSLAIIEKNDFKKLNKGIGKKYGFLITDLKNFQDNFFKIVGNNKLLKEMSKNILSKNFTKQNLIINKMLGVVR